MPATHRGQRYVALPIAVLLAFVFAVSLASPADASMRQRKIHHALEVARNQKGDPYRYGANGPRAFDCSGLIQFSYGRAGLFMPRTSGAQARRARHNRKGHMRKGDLMFFYDRGGVYHVGMFVGWNGHGHRRVLHAPRPGHRVHASTVWTGRWRAETLRRRH
jgi:cell wall-associated NlpC family hydrolase